MTVSSVKTFGPTKKNQRRTVGSGSYGVSAVVSVTGTRYDAEMEGRRACFDKFNEVWGPLGTFDGVILTHTHLTVQCVTELRIDPF